MASTSTSDSKLAMPWVWSERPLPRNVYEWLDEVRQRPTMWLQHVTLRELHSQIEGYDMALCVHDINEDGPPLGEGTFTEWLILRKRWSDPRGWAYAIEKHTRKGKDPLDVFFRLLDEYRKLRVRVMCHVILGPHHAPTGKRCIIGMDRLLLPPQKIEVMEYEPEPLHFLRFHYPECHAASSGRSRAGTLDQGILRNSDNEPATTVEDAQRWVEDEFGVQPSEWVREA